MPRKHSNTFALLAAVPCWVSLCAAAMAYFLCRFVIPVLARANPADMLGNGIGDVGPYLAAMLALIAPLSLAGQRLRRGLRATHADLDSIRAMDGQNFELLVVEGFRRLGYSVEERAGPQPGGGIDIDLRKDGARTIVRYKHWRTQEIGVAKVRDLYNVMISERAAVALLVTSGDFTPEAQAFAKDKPMGLIDGPALLELVNTVQIAHSERLKPAIPPAPACPVCERPMIKRKAGRDSTIGQVFWGCTQYPSCKGARAL
jgi:restriction system protein